MSHFATKTAVSFYTARTSAIQPLARCFVLHQSCAHTAVIKTDERNIRAMLTLLLCAVLLANNSAKAETKTYYLGAVETGREELSQSDERHPYVFTQYTDESYTGVISKQPWYRYIGPTIESKAGDIIVIVLRNFIASPVSIVTNELNYGQETVLPGETRTYKWNIPSQLLGVNQDQRCQPYLYYSDGSPEDVHDGLYGCLLVCKQHENRKSDVETPNVFIFVVDQWRMQEDSLRNDSFSRDNAVAVNGIWNIQFDFQICQSEMFILGISRYPITIPIFLNGAHFQLQSSEVSGMLHLLPWTGISTEILVSNPTQDITISTTVDHFKSKVALKLCDSEEETDSQDPSQGRPGYLQRERDEHSRGRGHGRKKGRTKNPGRGRPPLSYHTTPPPSKNIRTYFIAIEHVFWDYAPSGRDLISGDKLTENYKISKEYFQPSDVSLGGKYMKAKYVEYTDATFTTKGEAKNELGITGPTIRVEVNEVLRVVLFNNVSREFNINIPELQPYSLNSTNEGILHGQTATFEWNFPRDIEVGPQDEECRTFMYSSSVNLARDMATGLLGACLLCQSNSLSISNEQVEIDREIVLMYGMMNENLNRFIDDNIYWGLHKRGSEVNQTKLDEKFIKNNKMYNVNGFSFGNLLQLRANVGEVISVHVVCIGDEKEMYTIKFANHTWWESLESDAVKHLTIELASMMTRTLYIEAENSGIFEIENMNLKAYSRGLQAVLYVDDVQHDDLMLADQVSDDDWDFEDGGEDNFGFLHWGDGDSDEEDEEEETEPSPESTHTREYFIAAVDVEWNYLSNETENENSTKSVNEFKKVVYREFTNSNFTEMKIRGPEENHLGILGPVIKAEVGDTIIVHFHNRGCSPFSLHPKDFNYGEEDSGKFVLKNADRLMNKNSFIDMQEEGVVWPGNKHTYMWTVPEDYLEAEEENELNKCKSSMYYSNVYPLRDMNTGLIGPILICSKDSMGEESETHSVDTRYFVGYKDFDEKQSWYYPENYLIGNQPRERFQFRTINGFALNTIPTADMNTGDLVAWHLLSFDSYLQSVQFDGIMVFAHLSTSDVEYQTTGSVFHGSVIHLIPGASRTLLMNLQHVGEWSIANKYETEFMEDAVFRYQVQNRDCSNKLGMASRLISDGQITTSSTYETKGLFGMTTGKWCACNARLNMRGHNNAWIPDRRDPEPWIQVDFGSTTRITGIVTQGTRVGWINKYVTSFAVQYSLDGFESYYVKENWSKKDKIFTGNIDGVSPHTTLLSPRIIARYLRIVVRNYQNQPALRLEFIGCWYKVECEESLGVAWSATSSPRIPDHAMRASSKFIYKRAVHWEAWYGRLHYVLSDTPSGDTEHLKAPAWSPQKSNRRQWLEVDLGEPTAISAIVTQGAMYKNSKLFVKSYLLHYSIDGRSWKVYKDRVHNRRRILRGNIDATTPVTQRLAPPVRARYIRLQPWSWRGRIAMRVDVLGCLKHEEEDDVVSVDGRDCVVEKLVLQ